MRTVWQRLQREHIRKVRTRSGIDYVLRPLLKPVGLGSRERNDELVFYEVFGPERQKQYLSLFSHPHTAITLLPRDFRFGGSYQLHMSTVLRRTV
jgi:hypothetical protein